MTKLLARIQKAGNVTLAIKKSDKDVCTEIKIIAKWGYSNGRH